MLTYTLLILAFGVILTFNSCIVEMEKLPTLPANFAIMKGLKGPSQREKEKLPFTGEFSEEIPNRA